MSERKKEISLISLCTAANVSVICLSSSPPLSFQIYQQDGRKDTHSRELAASSSELDMCGERERESKRDQEMQGGRQRGSVSSLRR